MWTYKLSDHADMATAVFSANLTQILLCLQATLEQNLLCNSVLLCLPVLSGPSTPLLGLTVFSMHSHQSHWSIAGSLNDILSWLRDMYNTKGKVASTSVVHWMQDMYNTKGKVALTPGFTVVLPDSASTSVVTCHTAAWNCWKFYLYSISDKAASCPLTFLNCR